MDDSRCAATKSGMNRRDLLLGLSALALAGPAVGQQKWPLVAILSPSSRDPRARANVNQPFKEALAKLGYQHGHTIEIVERFAENDESRLPALAAELVALQPRVLFTNTSVAGAAAAHATRTIPIVVGPGGEHGLLELAGGSLARPATNVTGFVLTSPDIDNKGIAMLMEAVPSARRIGLLVNPRNPGMKDYPAPQEAALGRSGVTFVRVEAGGVKDVDTAFAKSSPSRLDALFVPDDSHLAGNPAGKGACAALGRRSRFRSDPRTRITRATARF